MSKVKTDTVWLIQIAGNFVINQITSSKASVSNCSPTMGRDTQWTVGQNKFYATTGKKNIRYWAFNTYSIFVKLASFK